MRTALNDGLACSSLPELSSAPIRAREKRMNCLYRRMARPEGSEQSKKIFLHPGTKLFSLRIVNQKVPGTSKEITERQNLEALMDAKWNNVIDRFSVRVGLLVVGFGIWLAISYGILAA